MEVHAVGQSPISCDLAAVGKRSLFDAKILDEPLLTPQGRVERYQMVLNALNSGNEAVAQKRRERALQIHEATIRNRIERNKADGRVVAIAQMINSTASSRWSESQRAFMAVYDDLQDLANNHPRFAGKARPPDNVMISFMSEAVYCLERDRSMPAWPGRSARPVSLPSQENANERKTRKDIIQQAMKDASALEASMIKKNYLAAKNNAKREAAQTPPPNVAVTTLEKPSPVRAVPPKKRALEVPDDTDAKRQALHTRYAADDDDETTRELFGMEEGAGGR